MWIKTSDGEQLVKCIRVYLKKGKKQVELIGVIDCSTYGEQFYVLGTYDNFELAKIAFDKVSDAIEKGERMVTL